MKLLFDLAATQPNISGKRHGGGRYGEIILLRMIERNIKFGCFYDGKKWLNPEIKNACEHAGIVLHDINHSSVEQIVKNEGYTRLYSCFPGNLAELSCCEVYGTLHGLREFETPFDNIYYSYKHSFKENLKFTIKKLCLRYFHSYKHKKYLSRYINSSLNLITVSEHSRYALLSYFPEIAEDRMKVFYSPNTSNHEKIQKNKSVPKYFLAVSGNRWEKNNLRAIIAFDRLVTEKRIPADIKMIVTGTKGDSFKYKIQNPSRFLFPGYVDDIELEHLYADAYLFVYPSLNEGFGYPPIEALRYNVPVIASPFSSIAEICAGGALYFNPFSVEEIMNRMMMMLDSKIYDEYVEKGKNQYKKIIERQAKDLDGLIDYILQEK